MNRMRWRVRETALPAVLALAAVSAVVWFAHVAGFERHAGFRPVSLSGLAGLMVTAAAAAPDVPGSRKEPGAADQKKEPGAADQKKEPGAADQKKEPGAADQKKEPGAADQKKEPGAADQKKEPGAVDQKQETGAADQKKEADAADRNVSWTNRLSRAMAAVERVSAISIWFPPLFGFLLGMAAEMLLESWRLDRQDKATAAAAPAGHPQHEEELRQAEADIARALQLDEPRVPFRLAAAEIRKTLEEYEAEFKAELAKRSRPAAPTAAQARNAAAIACVDDATAALDEANANPELQQLDQALGMGSALPAARSFLAQLQSATDFGGQLLSGLERGELDHALSTANVLNSYFPDHPAVRRLRIAYNSLELLLLPLLDEQGVQILQPAILSVVGAAEIPNVQAGDRRNLKSIRAIRDAAAQIARELGPGEFLIVDCQAPGWVSTKIGRRQPLIAIFDPSSWT
jgi:hypothetical protein